jgi:hypothetical protein
MPFRQSQCPGLYRWPVLGDLRLAGLNPTLSAIFKGENSQSQQLCCVPQLVLRRVGVPEGKVFSLSCAGPL